MFMTQTIQGQALLRLLPPTQIHIQPQIPQDILRPIEEALTHLRLHQMKT